MPDREFTAVAHWIEETGSGRTLLCADTDAGDTITIDVTGASYGGLVEVGDS